MEVILWMCLHLEVSQLRQPPSFATYFFFLSPMRDRRHFLPAGKQFKMLPLGMSAAFSQLSRVCAEKNLRWRKGCGQSRKVYLSWVCMSVDVWFIVLDDDGAQDLVPVHKYSTPELRLQPCCE